MSLLPLRVNEPSGHHIEGIDECLTKNTLDYLIGQSNKMIHQIIL